MPLETPEDRMLTAYLAAGRISPERVEDWRALLERDRFATARVLAGLPSRTTARTDPTTAGDPPRSCIDDWRALCSTPAECAEIGCTVKRAASGAQAIDAYIPNCLSSRQQVCGSPASCAADGCSRRPGAAAARATRDAETSIAAARGRTLADVLRDAGPSCGDGPGPEGWDR